MSLVALATNMAIEHNNKILIVSTTNREDKISSCFFENKSSNKKGFNFLGQAKPHFEFQGGIEGLVKMNRSNKLTPEIITNYTKVVFKDRLEVVLGSKDIGKQINNQAIDEDYVDIINIANMHYDMVFVDLDSNIPKKVREKIIKDSDLVIANINQNYRSLKKLKENKEENELLKLPKTLLLIGRYDKYSKYNFKNVTRYLGEKNQVLTVPYNTLYFEAANEAGVADLFLKLKKLSDSEDRNAIFVEEIKRASENIIYRLQELQAIM